MTPAHRAYALVFPGQGSQRVGLLDGVPENDDLPRLLDAAEALTDLPLRFMAERGPEEEFSDTRAAQPLLYLTDWAWGRALIDAGLEPSAVAGHSLGEYAALAIAGVFSVEAGLELVVERSRLMASAAAVTPGGMAAVIGLDRDRVQESLDAIGGVWIANDNTPGQIVISGSHISIERSIEALTGAGARRVLPLKVAGAFHTPLMAPAAEAFAEILRQAEFSDASVPIYQNTDPRPATDAETLRARLIGQIQEPVRWTETMAALASDGIGLLVEAGPGSVLTGLARRAEGVEGIAVEEAGIGAILEEVRS